jgi:hypothetical protein
MHFRPVRRLISLVSASALVAMLAVSSFPAGVLAATPTSFFNGFETDTTGWSPLSGSTVTQVPSGDVSSSYASGVPAATGSYYARLGMGTNTTCQNGGGTQDLYYGPYTYFGGYSSTFPTGGYSTGVDIYLDVTYAQANPDTRFDWSSAVNDPTGNFRRDFVFNVATDSNGFVIAGGNNANRCSTDPVGATNRIAVATSGWYTFKHTFSDVGGVLSVRLDLINKSTLSVVGSWVLSNSADTIGGTVGGNRYGWFVQNEFDGLAIDNSRLDVPGHSSFSGFYAPIDNSGTVNTVKGGSVVPVKFNLYDGSGLQVTDPSLVNVVASPSTLCVSTVTTDAVEALSAAATALRYDTTAGQFIWNWKTPKSPGSCWAVTATATDGVSITALFLLK